ncbi:M-phase-specific PLK1-interacting protein [Aulostomus maculatus]
MYRTPVRPQQSPVAPRFSGRFPSPSSCWAFPGARTPYGGSGHRGGSPRGYAAYSPGSPVYSSGFNQGYRDGSPAGGGRSFGESPGGFRGGGRGYGGPRRRGDGFRRPRSYSPTSAHNLQPQTSESVEKYFSPSMVQDPWAGLQPPAAAPPPGRQQ